MSSGLKNDHLELRLAPAVKAQLERAAEIQGQSVSDFVLEAAMIQASQLIEQQMVLSLCMEDRIALAQALSSVQKPNRKAIQAAKRHKARIGPQ